MKKNTNNFLRRSKRLANKDIIDYNKLLGLYRYIDLQEEIKQIYDKFDKDYDIELHENQIESVYTFNDIQEKIKKTYKKFNKKKKYDKSTQTSMTFGSLDVNKGYKKNI